jgi:hypothetical protein
MVPSIRRCRCEESRTGGGAGTTTSKLWGKGPAISLTPFHEFPITSGSAREAG